MLPRLSTVWRGGDATEAEVEEEATWEKGEGEKANKYVDNAVPVSQSVKLGLSLHLGFRMGGGGGALYAATGRSE